jgi:alkyl hydroperoxide reductase subunit AhpC
MSTGRNFQEILRAIDSIQLTAKYPVSTPADWQPGEDIVIAGSVSDEDAIKRFGPFETILPYIRKAKQPSS